MGRNGYKWWRRRESKDSQRWIEKTPGFPRYRRPPPFHFFGTPACRLGDRLFIHTGANPCALVMPVTRVIRDTSVDQHVEHAATLEDVCAEVLQFRVRSMRRIDD